MSLTLDRLKALRRQAGRAVPVSGPQDSAGHGGAAAAMASGASSPDVGMQASARALDERTTTEVGAAAAPVTAVAQAHPCSDGPARPAGDAVHGPATAPPRSAFAWAVPDPRDAPRRGVQPRDPDALRRLLATRAYRPSATAAAGPARPARLSAPVDRSLPGTEISPGLWLREAFVPQPAPQAPLPLTFAKRPDDTVMPADLLFFDTETTGLAGGTGTRAFMIGAADWQVAADGRQGLRVRQLTLATLGAEAAMLRVFAGWLGPGTVLSSYNGRCYDAPLLKTRYRLARLPDPLSACDHVDLLFPARRHWRGRWENCRLSTIERQVLGIVREDDLPGSQAPAAWLGYLRGGGAHDVHRVAAHNHQDVVTLAHLFLRLVQVQPPQAPGDAGACRPPGAPSA